VGRIEHRGENEGLVQDRHWTRVLCISNGKRRLNLVRKGKIRAEGDGEGGRGSGGYVQGNILRLETVGEPIRSDTAGGV